MRNDGDGTPLVWAHRGSMSLAPENTAPAFDLALDLGADVLETDVRLSRDGVPMVVHDARLERTTDGRGRVRDHTARALGGLDAGARFRDLDGRSWRGRGARVESLDALLERYPHVPVNVDIKDPDDAAADAVAACLARRAGGATVTVGSFHGRALARFRERAPDVPTAAGPAEVAAFRFGRSGTGRPGGAPRAVPYRWLQVPPSRFGVPLATRRFIARARALGVGCVYWTIDDPVVMRRLVARGAAGVVTNRPDLAVAALGRADPQGRTPAGGR